MSNSGGERSLPPPPSYDQIFGSGNGTSNFSTSPPVPSNNLYNVNRQPSSGIPPASAVGPRFSNSVQPAAVDYDDSEIWFAAVDENGDGRISLYELQEALINFDGKPFNLRTCRFLVRMFDDNNDGTIDLQEFRQLKAYIDRWKREFDRTDVDGSGNIDVGELAAALSHLGYQLSPQVPSCVMSFFGNTANRSSMNFDAFIRSCAFIQTMSSAFYSRQQQRNEPADSVSFDFESFAKLIFEHVLTEDY